MNDCTYRPEMGGISKSPRPDSKCLAAADHKCYACQGTIKQGEECWLSQGHSYAYWHVNCVAPAEETPKAQK